MEINPLFHTKYILWKTHRIMGTMKGNTQTRNFKNKHQDVYLKHDFRLFMLLQNSQGSSGRDELTEAAWFQLLSPLGAILWL